MLQALGAICCRKAIKALAVEVEDVVPRRDAICGMLENKVAPAAIIVVGAAVGGLGGHMSSPVASALTECSSVKVHAH